MDPILAGGGVLPHDRLERKPTQGRGWLRSTLGSLCDGEGRDSCHFFLGFHLELLRLGSNQTGELMP